MEFRNLKRKPETLLFLKYLLEPEHYQHTKKTIKNPEATFKICPSIINAYNQIPKKSKKCPNISKALQYTNPKKPKDSFTNKNKDILAGTGWVTWQDFCKKHKNTPYLKTRQTEVIKPLIEANLLQAKTLFYPDKRDRWNTTTPKLYKLQDITKNHKVFEQIEKIHTEAIGGNIMNDSFLYTSPYFLESYPGLYEELLGLFSKDENSGKQGRSFREAVLDQSFNLFCSIKVTENQEVKVFNVLPYRFAKDLLNPIFTKELWQIPRLERLQLLKWYYLLAESKEPSGSYNKLTFKNSLKLIELEINKEKTKKPSKNSQKTAKTRT